MAQSPVASGRARVQPGQQQQVFDQTGHPGGFGFDAAQGMAGVGAGFLVAAAGQLGIAPDRGQRGTQLVAGVGHELAYPHLALLPGGQGGGDVAQHSVEGCADLADLGPGVGLCVGHPLVQSGFTAVQGEF